MISMILLDLDPNVVKPGWTPALITLGLAVAIVLLYLSMRNQVRRINVPYANAESSPEAADTPDPGPAPAGSAADEATTDAAEIPSATRPAS